MVRRKLPVVEGLEERTLLSSVSYSLTTDQSVYQVGQPIKLKFTETNTSDQPVTVEVSPTDFTISQNSATIWQSDPASRRNSLRLQSRSIRAIESRPRLGWHTR